MVHGDGEIRLVLTRAEAAARRARAGEINPGHLLLGIIDLPGSRGTALLEELGLDLDQLRRAIDLMSDAGRGLLPVLRPTLSASSIRVLEQADADVGRAGIVDCGSDDLLLAIVEVGGSIIGGILESLGVTTSAARSAIARMRGDGPEEERLPKDDSIDSTSHEDAGQSEATALEFMSPEWADALRGRSEIMPDLREPGSLIRVVSIGQVAAVGDVEVQLTALEVREGIMYLHWRAYSSSPRWLGPPDVVVSDALGARYGVMAGHWTGGDTEWSGEMWIGPSLPDDARELTIDVIRFGEPSPLFHMREDIPHGPLVGPWRFVVDV